MSYAAQTGNAVNLVFGDSSYAAPSGTAVNFDYVSIVNFNCKTTLSIIGFGVAQSSAAISSASTFNFITWDRLFSVAGITSPTFITWDRLFSVAGSSTVSLGGGSRAQASFASNSSTTPLIIPQIKATVQGASTPSMISDRVFRSNYSLKSNTVAVFVGLFNPPTVGKVFGRTSVFPKSNAIKQSAFSVIGGSVVQGLYGAITPTAFNIVDANYADIKGSVIHSSATVVVGGTTFVSGGNQLRAAQTYSASQCAAAFNSSYSTVTIEPTPDADYEIVFVKQVDQKITVVL